MALPPGTRLGVYEVTAQIGEGGMGQVYRATDTKLNRDVALKILPDGFASDPDRLARFTREAQTLASLNHPNVAHIHGLEESNGVRALVMELVEGEDLSRRIPRGAIPLDEALLIAKQIAEALEAAHEQGIIHRDLKPANIKVRLDGTVKVLDFGLAKAMDPAGAVSSNASKSPTLTTPAMTQAGMILGTAAYMSPEQARSKPVDKRTDLWAFGCVLYEMLTARRAFGGDEVSDVIASVIKDTPAFDDLPSEVPVAVRRLLRRCLVKDRHKRLDSATAARLDIEEALASPATPLVDELPRVQVTNVAIAGTRKWLWPAAVIFALFAGIAAGYRLAVSPALPVDASYLEMSVAPAESLGPRAMFDRPSLRSFAVTPDGTRVVFIGSAKDTTQLFVRRFDARSAVALEGLSPDGSLLVFQTRGGDTGSDLWVTPVQGTAEPRPLVHTPANEAWAEISPDGRWLAYASDATGQTEVYVQPFPGSGPRHRISFTRATCPLWRRDGRELFFVSFPGGNLRTVWAVPVTVGSTFSAGEPREMFTGSFITLGSLTGFDVSLDGQRLLMVEPLDPPRQPVTRLHVVLNWLEELKRLVPAK